MTVLYEDRMLPGANGSYPLHDLVMRLVEDQINGQTWTLRKRVHPNPRKGIGNVLKDVRSTSLLAGDGALYLLVDRDVVANHLGLPADAEDEDVIESMRSRSDARDRLYPFFLYRHLEDLLRAIATCNPNFMADRLEAALRKDLNARDAVLAEAAKAAHSDLRACVARYQPGILGLATALAARLREA